MNTSFYGRLTRDPEVKTSQKGTQYTTITVATNLPIKDPNGSGRKSLFIFCTAFGAQGESIAKFFKKGNRIVVDGIVNDINIGHGQNGGEYLNINVNLTNFHIVETQSENEGQTGQNAQGYAQPPQANPAPPTPPQNSAPWGNPPPVQTSNYNYAPY